MTCVYIITFKTLKIFKPEARGKVISVTSQVFLMLRISRSVIKYCGLRYAPDIQRWIQIFSLIFGQDTSPSFLIPTIKTSKRHFFLFLSQFVISKHSHLHSPYFITVHHTFTEKGLQRSLKDTKISSHHNLRKFRFPNFL